MVDNKETKSIKYDNSPSLQETFDEGLGSITPDDYLQPTHKNILQGIRESQIQLNTRVDNVEDKLEEGLQSMNNAVFTISTSFAKLDGKLTILLWVLGILLPILVISVIGLGSYTVIKTEGTLIPEIKNVNTKIEKVSEEVSPLIMNYKIRQINKSIPDNKK